MALILSAASGNFNAGATWVGGVVPTVGDEGRASTGHTITITANATCDEVSNSGTGIFTLNDGVTLTANVSNKSTTASSTCVQFTAASPASGFIVGDLTGSTTSQASSTTTATASLNSTGTLTITGNCTGGIGNFAVAAKNNSTGILNIIGNVIGGSGNNAFGANNILAGSLTITGNVSGGTITTAIGVNNASTGVVTITSTTITGTVAIAVLNSVGGTVNITGNVTGGTATGIGGISNAGNGAITVTGNVTGGTLSNSAHGLSNGTTGICTIVGICTGGPNGSSGANNASTGTVRATRAVGNAYGPSNSAGLAAAVGISNVALGICEIEQFEFGTFGQSPTSGTGIRLKKASTNLAVFNYCDTAGAKTLIDATANAAMPASTDVRSGVSYASGAATGSCAVPAAGSVALGVPVDATTGTAVLTGATVATAVWGAVARTITGGTITGAADITAIKAKTDLLNTDRLGQVATTSIVGNLIAQSNS